MTRDTRTEQKYRPSPISAGDVDFWDRKTVQIDRIDNQLGTTLFLPMGSKFRFTRNDDFMGDQGFIRRYEIDSYPNDMKQVWDYVWLLHQGVHQPKDPKVRQRYPDVFVEYAIGFMPVLLPEVHGEYNPNGVIVPRVDRVTMEYFQQGQADEPTDRVYVFLEFGDLGKTEMQEGGAASGPPH